MRTSNHHLAPTHSLYQKPPPPRDAWKYVIIAAMISVCFFAIALLTGCMESTARQEAHTIQHEETVISGSVSLPSQKSLPDGTSAPFIIEAPIQLTISKDTESGTQSTTATKTNIDATAISKTIGDAVRVGLSQIAPTLGPLLGQPKPSNGLSDGLIGLLATATLSLTGYAAAKRSTSTELKKQVEFHKADAAEAWNQLKETAKYQPTATTPTT